MSLGSEVEERSRLEPPPLGERWRYELYGHRLPSEYRDWAEHDIASRSWPWRVLAARSLMFCVVIALIGVLRSRLTAAYVVGLLTFVLVGALFTPFVANRQREYALRSQGISGEQTFWNLFLGSPYAPYLAAAAVASVVLLVIALVPNSPLFNAAHPDRCTTPPSATEATIWAGTRSGVRLGVFEQRRHGRWTGIAAPVESEDHRLIATWVEDRSTTPHRIMAADTLAIDVTPGLPALGIEPGFTDALHAAQSARSCRFP